jgi:glycine/D-amino acid oxidase-like deaminating enzyme
MSDRLKKFETWYEATVRERPSRQTLASASQADVCIIGGGLAGLVCALELARAGKAAILLEARQIASGASGRNGGFVSNGFAEGVAGIVNRAGLDAAKRLYRLSSQGTEYVRNEIAALDPASKIGDGVIVVRRHSDRDGIERQADFMRREFGEPLGVLSVPETRALLRTKRYFEALRNPRSFHIHPLRYALALAAEAERRGASIHEHSRVVGIARQGASWLIRTDRGSIHAGHVVHCTSALDRSLHPETGRAILPVSTYVAVTEPMSQDAIRTASAIADTRRAGDYYRVIDNGRIMWGGRITTRLSEPGRLAAKLKRDMLSVYPQLGGPAIDYAWSGIMGYALHKMPLIGRSADGQWYATAFGGHGLNTTAMAGCLIANAIVHGDDSYRQFAMFRSDWAGGPFGRIGVQASYWWMQLRDRIEEAKAPR